MTHTNIPGLASERGGNANARQVVFDEIRLLLREAALRAIHDYRMDARDFIAICIMVVPRWRDLADDIAPGNDWDELTKDGRIPVVVGATDWEVCYKIAKQVPGFMNTMRVQAETGLPQAVCVAPASVTVYNVWPALDS